MQRYELNLQLQCFQQQDERIIAHFDPEHEFNGKLVVKSSIDAIMSHLPVNQLDINICSNLLDIDLMRSCTIQVVLLVF